MTLKSKMKKILLYVICCLFLINCSSNRHLSTNEEKNVSDFVFDSERELMYEEVRIKSEKHKKKKKVDILDVMKSEDKGAKRASFIVKTWRLISSMFSNQNQE